MNGDVLIAEYNERRADHNAIIELVGAVRETRADVAEVKTLLQAQNGRIRKLEERWWIAMGALLAASTIVNWALFQLMPAIVRTVFAAALP